MGNAVTAVNLEALVFIAIWVAIVLRLLLRQSLRATLDLLTDPTFLGVGRAALAAVGLVLLGLTVMLLVSPDLLPVDRSVVSWITESVRDQGLIVLGGIAVVGALVMYLWKHVLRGGASHAPDRASEPLPYPPESVRTTRSERAGETLDSHLENIGTTNGHRHSSQLETTLEEAALRALVVVGDHDETAARDALAAGAWTADTRAATFLGGPDAPRPSWRTELWDLLRPMPKTERRVRHTIDALEAYVARHDQGVTGDT